MKFHSIRAKILFFSSLSLLILGAVIIGYSTFYVKDIVTRNAKYQFRNIANSGAGNVLSKLNEKLTSLQSLALILEKTKDSIEPLNIEREQVDILLQSFLNQDRNTIGVYTCWLPNAFDEKDKFYENEPGHGKTGRFSSYWYRNKYGIVDVQSFKREDENDFNQIDMPHTGIKQSLVSDPHVQIINGKPFQVVSIIIPITINGEYFGITGLDIGLKIFKRIIEKTGVETYAGRITIISASGKIVGETGRPDMTGKDVFTLYGNMQQPPLEMAQGKSFEISSQTDIKFFSPVIIPDIPLWWVMVSIPKDKITAEARSLSGQLAGVGIFCLGIILCFSWFFSNSIIKPLNKLMHGIKEMTLGGLDVTIEGVSSRNEIGILVEVYNQMVLKIRQREGERDTAFELLRSSEKKYQTIMKSMKEPLYIGSQNLIIKYMNSAMIKRTGHDATGERCFKAIHDLDERCPWCHHEDLMDSNSYELDTVSPKDNHSFHISVTPFVNNDGSISSMNVLRDITEFKKMEAQVQQSQKMESIGTLAGGIAHDFNNILFPILGHTQMLMDDIPDDSPFKESLKEIYVSALRAKDLVQQILAFSRQESSELKLMKMQPIIKEALKLIRSTIPTTISINQNIQPDCGAVKANPTQVHQIVMNLATNAYHAMENNGGELKVSLKAVELSQQDLIHTDLTPGKYACMTISDTGIGITKDVIDKIFEPFFTTKEKGKGTGMGLSVVHGIIKTMSGEIVVDSELGKGTEFHVYLPIAESAFKIEESQIKEPIRGGDERILLVDDEEVILKMETQALERLGYQITSRASSIDALEAFKANPNKFDLVITDMAMPNLTGDKLAVELIKIRPDIPILLCTGFSEAITEEKIKSMGIKDLLLKPIIIKDLARKIREVLDEIDPF